MLDLLVTDYKDILFNTARIFSSVFEIVLAYILAGNFFHPRRRRGIPDVLLYSLVAAGVIFIQEYGFLTAYRYILEIAALTALLFLLYADNIGRKTVGVMVFSVMIAVSQIGGRFLFSLLVQRLIETPELNAQFLQLLQVNVSNILLILMAVFISVLSRHFGKTAAPLLLWTVLLTVPVVTMVIFSVFQYYVEHAVGVGQMLPYIYLSCLGLVFVNVLVFVLFARLQKQMDLKRDADMLRAQLGLQEASITRLETLYNRTRSFRHDIKNHILLLNMMAEQEKYGDLRAYLQELSGVIDESDYVRISGVSAVDAILNEKMYEAQAVDITTSFDVAGLDRSSAAPIDLCIILSNALDNAIEANLRIEDKTKRFIKVKLHGGESFTVISVSNPTDRPPARDHEGRIVTSKPNAESHGFGLRSIENTAEKYRGEMLAKEEDGVFTLVVRLNAAPADARRGS